MESGSAPWLQVVPTLHPPIWQCSDSQRCSLENQCNNQDSQTTEKLRQPSGTTGSRGSHTMTSGCSLCSLSTRLCYLSLRQIFSLDLEASKRSRPIFPPTMSPVKRDFGPQEFEWKSQMESHWTSLVTCPALNQSQQPKELIFSGWSDLDPSQPWSWMWEQPCGTQRFRAGPVTRRQETRC